MLSVGDDHRAVGELHLVAGPAQHDLRRGHHSRRPPVGAQQLITDGDVAHRRPAVRCRQRRIQRQCLPDPGPGRQDDHLTRVQAVGHLVELGEPGRHPAGQTAIGGDRVDLVHGRLQQVLQRDEVLGQAPIGDVVDLGLRAVDHLSDVGAVGARVAVLHHPGAGLHQPAQQRLLGDDLRVVAGIGRRRHHRDQGVQIRRAADPAQQPATVQLGGHRHRVGRLPAPVEVQDGVVDVLVRRAVEVAGPQLLQHVGDRVLAQQHSAQYRLLGGQILRGLTAVVLAGRIRAGASEIVNDCHGLPTSSGPTLERTFDIGMTLSHATDTARVKHRDRPATESTLKVAGKDSKRALFIDLCIVCAYPSAPVLRGCGELVEQYAPLRHHCR